MVVDLWGLFCGIDMVRGAWRERKGSRTMQGYAEMGLYMTLNVVLWLLILGQAFVLPVGTSGAQSGSGAFLTAIFFAASVTITLALHRGRSLLFAPKVEGGS